MKTPILALLGAACLAALTGCAHVRSAQMAVPAELQAATERLELKGLGHGRSGQAQIDGRALRYERGASRTNWFSLYVSNKSTLAFSLDGEPPAQADCRASSGELRLGSGLGAVKPLQLRCSLGENQRLSMAARDRSGRRISPEPVGELELGGRRLTLLANYHLEGAALDPERPAGYFLQEHGKLVAAIDTTASPPTAYLPRGDAALREASLRAALVLSLLWAPD